MAEQRVWNKKLLVVSFITAVVAVGLFYVYDSIQQRKITGDVVEVLKWRRDLRAGEEINPADIAVVKITRQAVQALEGVMRKEDMKGMVTDGAHVNRDVRRQGFVLFQDIIEIQGDRPSRGISTGKCAFTLPVDPSYVPGRLLRVGDRVNLLGEIALPNTQPKAYTLVKNLRVLAVGGEPTNPDTLVGSDVAKKHRPGARVYRSLTVEVNDQLAEVLIELLPRIIGRVYVTVRSPNDIGQGQWTIDPVVAKALKIALPKHPGAYGPPE